MISSLWLAETGVFEAGSALKKLEILWRWARGQTIRHRVQLALSLRVTIAAVLSLVIAQAANLPLPLWAVLTSMIVTQMSVGRSLKATWDYLKGTLGGAVYGGLVAVTIPHGTELSLLGVLLLAVAPLALFAAIRPNMNVVPITAIIVLLVPTFTHASPLDSAINRVLEVGLGAIIGLLVSFLVLPSSAHRQMRQAAARALDHMARALANLLAGLDAGLDYDELHRLQDGIGAALIEINTIGAEAERERAARLSSEVDTGPLRRTLLRLRHDLVIVGRAALTPFPESLAPRLSPKLKDVAASASAYLQASGTALLVELAPASLEPFEKVLLAYDAEVEACRKDGLTRPLSADTAERFFALGFALEQLHQNFIDLQRVVREWAPETPASN